MRIMLSKFSIPLPLCLKGLTPRAADRETEFMLSKCSNGTPAKGNGEATPSSGPLPLLVGHHYWFI